MSVTSIEWTGELLFLSKYDNWISRQRDDSAIAMPKSSSLRLDLLASGMLVQELILVLRGDHL